MFCQLFLYGIKAVKMKNSHNTLLKCRMSLSYVLNSEISFFRLKEHPYPLKRFDYILANSLFSFAAILAIFKFSIVPQSSGVSPANFVACAASLV